MDRINRMMSIIDKKIEKFLPCAVNSRFCYEIVTGLERKRQILIEYFQQMAEKEFDNSISV